MVFIVSQAAMEPDDDVDGRIKATKYFHHCSPIKSEKEREKITSPKLRRISIDQIGHWRRGLVRLTCFVCVVFSCWLSPERWNSNVENYKILSPSLWNVFNLLDITRPSLLMECGRLRSGVKVTRDLQAVHGLFAEIQFIMNKNICVIISRLLPEFICSFFGRLSGIYGSRTMTRFSLIWYFISFSFHSRTFLGSLRLQSRRRRLLKRAKILHTEIAQRIRMKTRKKLRNKISSANKQKRRSESSTYRDSKISALLSGSHRAAASSPRMASVDLIKTVFSSSLLHISHSGRERLTHTGCGTHNNVKIRLKQTAAAGWARIFPSSNTPQPK